jgi:hypothetical protein
VFRSAPAQEQEAVSFNPLATLLAHALVDLLGERPSVVELGNQTFRPGSKALEVVIRRSAGHPRIDCDGLRRLLAQAPEQRCDKTAEYYRCLGFAEYQAIDVNETYGSLVMDLNRDLRKDYGFNRTFSLVTNIGTGEHVFDQCAAFRNVHNLTGKDGVMAHVMPCSDYFNHGLYSIHPNLYVALAAANGYRLICLGLAHRRGIGALAEPDPDAEILPPFLIQGNRIGLQDMLWEGALTARRAPLKRRLRGRHSGTPDGRAGAAQRIVRMAETHARLLVLAVMRKLTDQPFRLPFQSLYAGAISAPQIRSAYGAPETTA